MRALLAWDYVSIRRIAFQFVSIRRIKSQCVSLRSTDPGWVGWNGIQIRAKKKVDYRDFPGNRLPKEKARGRKQGKRDGHIYQVEITDKTPSLLFCPAACPPCPSRRRKWLVLLN
jgi:hypothetical protein